MAAPLTPQAAHARSSNHRDEVLQAERCGCFHCGELFTPDEITRWTDNRQTALCPRCGIDSVLPDGPAYPVTESSLERMRQHWFGALPTTD